MFTSPTPAVIDNGVNTEALIGARGAFAETPEAAAFTWRSVCDWQEGTYSVNTINGYFGLGQEHTAQAVVLHRSPITRRSSPPPTVR